MGKEGIVKLASSYLKAEHASLQVNSADFDISVWLNSQQVIVKFERKVKHTPLRFKGTSPPFYSSNVSFDLTVEILSATACRLDTWFAKDFYVPTNEDLENLAFLD